MSLPLLAATCLRDDHAVRSRLEGRAHVQANGVGDGLRQFDRGVRHERRDAVVQPVERSTRERAVADRQLRRRPARQPLGPVPSGHDVVCPEDERAARAANHAAEHALAPRGVTDDAIEGSAPHEHAQRAPCRGNAVRPPHRHGPERVNGGARRGQLGGQTTLEAQREFVAGGSGSAATRDGDEDRLDPAVKVAAVNVKDAH